MMKKIALIYMGGTFGCSGEPLTPMPAAEFLPLLQQHLAAQYQLQCFSTALIKDSSACHATDWLQLIQYIQQLQQQQHYQHFVIIHGTDTLSYAAAVLSRFLGNSLHVVLTGSQYPLLNAQATALHPCSDALDNLSTAFNGVLQCPAGVYVAFHHKLMLGHTVLKQHSSALDAFAGETDITDHPTVFCPATAIQAQHIQRANLFNCLSLMLQPLASQHLTQQLTHMLTNPPDFLILQGFGTGNIAADTHLIATLEQLHQAGCVVIVSTQVPFGNIESHYAISSWMQNSKIIRSNCAGHADLYAKALQMYLQYPTANLRWAHWHDVN